VDQLTPGRPIPEGELAEFLIEALQGFGRHGEHVLVVVPDDTRTVPMRLVFDVLSQHVAPRVRRVTLLVALGSHPAMTEAQLVAHLGEHWQQVGIDVVQHEWQNAGVLCLVGTIGAAQLETLSEGWLSEAVPVRIHRLALEADRILVVNPVFPHEVVGFSGGHKYFFPGISGPEILDVSHWLAALITNPKINGHKDTPTRRLIEQAASYVPTERTGLSIVMHRHKVVGAFVGEVHDAWSQAVGLSAEVNIKWVDRSFQTVVSVAPPMYRDLWTAGKCMYKLESVVADEGMLIILAPSLKQISPTHERWIRLVGYHVRDYFLADRVRFTDVPRAVLAHSTHVKGVGTYRNGVEHPRIHVQLATGIPKSTCQAINLGYHDPQAVESIQQAAREDEHTLLVPNAGEMLFRLSDNSVPDIDGL